MLQGSSDLCFSNPSDAARKLRALCLSPDADSAALRAAVDDLTRANEFETAFGIVRESVKEPHVNGQVGVLWMNLFVKRYGMSFEAEVDELLKTNPETGKLVLMTYLERLADDFHRFNLQGFAHRHKDMFRRDVDAWGLLGYALGKVGDHHGVVRYLIDWAERPGVQPWMLLNVATAFRYVKRRDVGARINRYALSIKPDHTSPLHALWLAADEGLQGNFDAAGELLSGVDLMKLNPFFRFMHGLVKAMVELRGHPREERLHAYRKTREQIRECARTFPAFGLNRELRRLYNGYVWLTAGMSGGGFPAFLRALFKSL